MTDVAAALIWRDGRFMICRRPEHKARGLLWEFPGGKLEPGETPKEALIRECGEELDVEIEVKDLFMELVYAYPDMDVHLMLYNASIASGTPKLLEHCDMRFITPEEIDGFEFCPADAKILEKLKTK